MKAARTKVPSTVNKIF